MNYLSHQFLARRIRPQLDAPPFFFVGNLLPDLLRAAGEGRLPILGEQGGPLAEGATLHRLTDQYFHGLHAFAEAQSEANTLLQRASWESKPYRQFFLAHVFVELALDGVVLTNSPTMPQDIYTNLTEALEGGLISAVESLSGKAVPHLRNSMEQFIESRFLYDYATPEGLADSLTRVSRRVGIPNFEHPIDQKTLAQIFVTFLPTIEKIAPDLLNCAVMPTHLCVGI